jgi:succinyl-CoA synthetase beta subunit
MNFHEYQSKQLLAEYGIPVPAGKVAATPDEAVAAANSLGQGPWMVKAQIHAGGRGKAGGVKFCKTTDDVKAAAAKMLGTKMATYQTAGVELPVNLVLVTTAGEIVKELYLSVLVDRGTKTITTSPLRKAAWKSSRSLLKPGADPLAERRLRRRRAGLPRP